MSDARNSYILKENWRKNREMEQEMQMPVEQQESEINLGDIFKALYKKLWVLLICLVVGALVGLVFTQVIYTYRPVYYSEVQMMLSGIQDDQNGTQQNPATDGNGMVINETTVTPALLRTTIYYLNSDLFRNTVKNEIGNELQSALVSGGTYDSVLLETRSKSDQIPQGGVASRDGTIVIYYVFDTNTSSFTAGISGANKDEVLAVANQLVVSIPESVSFDFTGSTNYENIELIKVNNIEAVLENPNEALTTNLRNIAIGAVLFLLLGVIVIVVVYLLDKRIKDVEEIPGLVGVSVLGIIPKLPEEITAVGQKNEKNTNGAEE